MEHANIVLKQYGAQGEDMTESTHKIVTMKPIFTNTQFFLQRQNRSRNTSLKYTSRGLLTTGLEYDGLRIHGQCIFLFQQR